MKNLHKTPLTATQKKSQLGILLMIVAAGLTAVTSGMRVSDMSGLIEKQKMLLQTKEKELKGTDAGTQEGHDSSRELQPSSTALRDFADQAAILASKRNVQLERVSSTQSSSQPAGGQNTHNMVPQEVELILTGYSLDLFRTIDDLRLSGNAFQYTSIEISRNQQGQAQKGQSRASIKAQVFGRAE